MKNNNENYELDKICCNVKKDLKKNKRYTFKMYEVIIMVVATCLLSFFAGSSIMELKLTRDDEVETIKETTNDENLEKLIKNYEFILDNYYMDIDKEELINGAIEGMMGVIEDPHSIYMLEEEYNNLNITLEGSYKGLGVEIIKLNDGNIQILTVFESSPAEIAGLQVGDIILSINNLEAKNLETSQFSDMVLNGEETEFTLKVLRNEQELEILVKKSNVSITSVSSKIIESNNKKIGYIYISVFANNTYQQFKQQLTELETNGIDSLIIDVRSNTGGHLTAAHNIASLFVSNEHYIYQLKKNKEITKIKSEGKETKKYPIVLLGDNYSASASELLIGCLKDNLGAILIGTQTYGKGTVQELMTLSNGDQYKLTTKEWLTPKGTSINNVGITPDIEVELSIEYYANPSDELDNQLQEAINYLSK